MISQISYNLKFGAWEAFVVREGSNLVVETFLGGSREAAERAAINWISYAKIVGKL